MARKRDYSVVILEAFDFIIAEGGGIEFIVANKKDAPKGFVYHVLAVDIQGKKHLLVRNKGKETNPYEIKTEISKTRFAQRRRVTTVVSEIPDPKKYPLLQ